MEGSLKIPDVGSIRFVQSTCLLCYAFSRKTYPNLKAYLRQYSSYNNKIGQVQALYR